MYCSAVVVGKVCREWMRLVPEKCVYLACWYRKRPALAKTQAIYTELSFDRRLLVMLRVQDDFVWALKWLFLVAMDSARSS